MRPVNLLPARYRPRSGGSADSKTSYIALGVLGLLVLAVFGYVMTANKANSRKAEIAETQQRIQAAEAQAVTLKGFGDFAGVKEARLTAVKTLATGRLDWERLFRELAHVLPEGVWLTKFSGGAPADDAGADEGSSIVLNGCAKSHAQIADVMVRLRELHIAEDVELKKTAASEEEAAAGGGAAAGAVPVGGGASTGASESGCGSNYSFDIDVAMAAVPPATTGTGAEPVPARLGGGE